MVSAVGHVAAAAVLEAEGAVEGDGGGVVVVDDEVDGGAVPQELRHDERGEALGQAAPAEGGANDEESPDGTTRASSRPETR